MTKKDFELIAKVIRNHINYINDAVPNLAQEITEELQKTNPRFDRERFLKACNVVDLKKYKEWYCQDCDIVKKYNILLSSICPKCKGHMSLYVEN